ncbi:unnamed protein product [Larinioides sclopetarius]|uniref:Uncharacterized protein n=1 Tax=Larinioides sclopetarius TaxID=280406 RepID=A0AAV2BT08_9ARAC
MWKLEQLSTAGQRDCPEVFSLVQKIVSRSKNATVFAAEQDPATATDVPNAIARIFRMSVLVFEGCGGARCAIGRNSKATAYHLRGRKGLDNSRAEL